MSDAVSQYLQGKQSDLREFASTFARLIAALAMDPHGYFEKKYIARIEQSDSEQEIRGVLVQLTQWVSGASISESQRSLLNKQLDEKGMPSLKELGRNLLP